MWKVVPKTYSRGSILPRARCFCRAFSGPPLSTRACSSFILAMTSRICLAFSLNSVAEVSTLVGSIDTADAWCACACVAIERPHRCWRFAIPRTAMQRAELTAKHLGDAFDGITTRLSSSDHTSFLQCASVLGTMSTAQEGMAIREPWRLSICSLKRGESRRQPRTRNN